MIKENMTPDAFSAYGETSPTTVRTRIGDLNFTKGGFAGGYPSLDTL